MWTSKKDFQVDLFASYRSSRLQRASKIVPMGKEIILKELSHKKTRPPKKVAAALGALDELILDTILWHQSFVMLLWEETKFENDSLRKSLIALLMRAAQDGMVVRQLIKDGYDAQARNLLRSMDEHMDTVYYLCLKPDLCDEFLKTEDGGLANKFWWTHIRKARAVIDVAVQKMTTVDPGVDAFSSFKAQEREMFSTAHHPSYLASTVPFIIPYEGISATRYIFGVPSEYSYRTGKFLFYLLAESVMVMSLFNEDVGRVISKRGRGAIRRMVRNGAQHMITMLFDLMKNWNSPIFDPSNEMRIFWAKNGRSA